MRHKNIDIHGGYNHKAKLSQNLNLPAQDQLNFLTLSPGPDSLQDNAALAREAFEQALSEVEAGNRVAARRWLDRACRLAPRDINLPRIGVMIDDLC